MRDKWEFDFSHEVTEATVSGNIDETIWNLWRENSSKIIILKKQNTLLISTAPNSGIHLYFTENRIVDSLDKIPGKELSTESIRQFLAFGYFPSSATLYKNVFCLKQGCYLYCDRDKDQVSSIPVNLDQITFTDRTLDEAVWKGCRIAVNQPYKDVWIALSGGLDSAVLFYCLKNLVKEPEAKGGSLHVMNVYANGGRDETEYLDILLKHEQNKPDRFCINETDAWEAFLRHAGRNEIFGFPIVLKYEFMMKALRKAGGKILVMGDGPDEAFVCRKTYEPYLDHDNSIFLPVHKKIRAESIPSDLFSRRPDKNIWAQYNMVFQGAANVRFLQNIANEDGITLIEPYLAMDVLEWCGAHTSEMVDLEEKELLKKYAAGKIPQEIICRSKLGYNSDFALWNVPGGRFYEELGSRLGSRSISGPLWPYRQQAEQCLLIEGNKKYNPQKRTGGTDDQGFLFSFLLLDEFIKRHWAV